MPDTTNATAEDQTRAAYDKVMSDVWRPVFFSKLAEYQVVPPDQRAAEQLVYLGNGLYKAHQEKLAAQARQQGTFFDFAVGQFDQAYSAGGYPEAQLKTAAAGVLDKNADLLSAAVTLANYVNG